MIPFRNILRAAVSVAFTTLATASLADGGTAWINWSKDNPLIVQSNGTKYTKVQVVIGDFVLRGRLEFDTDTVGSVKSWSAWPTIITGAGIPQQVPGLKTYKESKSYGVGDRPSSIAKNVEFDIPYSVIETYAVSMCNMLAEDLREQGKSNTEIFGKDRKGSLIASLNANVDSTGAGQGNQVWEGSAPYVVPVRCAKFAGAQVPQGGNGDLAGQPKIEAATMKLEENATVKGVCEVDTVTAVRADRAGMTFKYRFIHSTGQKSPVYSAKTAANKIAVVSKTWDIPNGAGAEIGWLQLEIISPSFKSSKAVYSMKCQGAGPEGVKPGN